MNLTLTLSTKLPSHMAGVLPQQVAFTGDLSSIFSQAFDELIKAKALGIFDAGGCVNIVVQTHRPELFNPRT